MTKKMHNLTGAKKWIKSALALAAILATCAPAIAQDAFPSGQWIDQDKMVVIRIAACAPGSADYCGIILRDDRPEAGQNPPNHQAVSDLRFTRGVWRGRISDAGATLSLTMRASGPDAAQVRMCFAGIACSSETWRRHPHALAPVLSR